MRIADLEKNNYTISVYQTFNDISDAPIDDEDIVFMGKIELDKTLYTDKEAVLFKMKMNEKGELHIRVYECQGEGQDCNIVLIEDKVVSIGG